MTWPGRRARLLAAVWIALACGLTARAVATGSLMSGDGVYHFAHLHSLVVDRDLDPANEIAHFQHEARSSYTGRPKIGDRVAVNPTTGEVVNKYPLGVSLAVLPAYLAVYGASRLMAAAGLPADVSGYGWTYQFAAALLVAAYATFGVSCCQRVAAWRETSQAEAWWAALLVAGATPWIFYATLEPLFAHALSATSTAALVWQWLRARRADSPGAWCLAGAVAGLGALLRYQDAVLILLPALDLLAGMPNRSFRRTVVCGLALGTGALMAVAPQLAANYHLFGHPFTTGYFGEGFVHWRAPQVAYALISPQVGLLRWSPIAALAVLGLAIGARRGWPHARLGLVLVGVQLYVVSSWYFLSQGHTFGNRMLVTCTVFFAIGMAALLTAVRDRPRLRIAILLVGVLLVVVNVVLMALWARGQIGPLGEY